LDEVITSASRARRPRNGPTSAARSSTTRRTTSTSSSPTWSPRRSARCCAHTRSPQAERETSCLDPSDPMAPGRLRASALRASGMSHALTRSWNDERSTMVRW